MNENDLQNHIMQTVQNAGGCTYLVGGSVRDALLGLASTDTDLLVTGLEMKVLISSLTSFARVDVVGAHFGVLKVSQENGVVIDVALPRTEHSTGIQHTDFEIAFDPHLSVETDLARRDFTVNAIAQDLSTQAFIDPFGGLKDLRRGILRAVGHAPQRFQEDPLRMLRAARFMAKLDFSLELETANAIRQNVNLILSVATERVQHELLGLLRSAHGDGVRRALRFLRDSGLLTCVIPEFANSIDFDQQNPHHQFTLDEHIFDAIEYAVTHNAKIETRLALLLHDIAKPSMFVLDDAGVGHYYGHEIEGALIAGRILKRWNCSNALIKSVIKIVRQHMRPPTQATDKVLRRWMNALGNDWEAALDCREADLNAHVSQPEFDARDWALSIRARCEMFAPEIANFDERALAFSGTQIMTTFKIKPGAVLGRLKKQVVKAVIDGEIENDPVQILAWLKTKSLTDE